MVATGTLFNRRPSPAHASSTGSSEEDSGAEGTDTDAESESGPSARHTIDHVNLLVEQRVLQLELEMLDKDIERTVLRRQAAHDAWTQANVNPLLKLDDLRERRAAIAQELRTAAVEATLTEWGLDDTSDDAAE